MELPAGHQGVMPYLMLKDGRAFIEFIQAVFDAKLTYTSERDGMLGHCEALISGSTVMFSDSRKEWGEATANLFVYVPDADEVYKAALSNGGKSVMEMSDQEYGRSGGFSDPQGNVWWVTTAP